MSTIKVSLPRYDYVSDDLLPNENEGSIEIKKELLAKLIKDSLQEANMRSSQFAEKVKKRPSEVTKWLSGSHNFTIDTLFQIEKELGITIINLSEPPKKVEHGVKLIQFTVSGVKLDLPKHALEICADNNPMSLITKKTIQEIES